VMPIWFRLSMRCAKFRKCRTKPVSVRTDLGAAGNSQVTFVRNCGNEHSRTTSISTKAQWDLISVAYRENVHQ
jgi:hypothetical protein